MKSIFHVLDPVSGQELETVPVSALQAEFNIHETIRIRTPTCEDLMIEIIDQNFDQYSDCMHYLVYPSELVAATKNLN